MKIKILNREVVYKGFFKIENVTLNNGSDTFQREIYQNKNAVAALVFNTVTQQYILTKQYRIAAESELLEIVAGLIDKPDEKPEETIIREIEEETGYETDTLIKINDFYTSPGACAEKITLFYAEVSNQISKGGGLEIENENIELVTYSKAALLETDFQDAKTLIAIAWLRNR